MTKTTLSFNAVPRATLSAAVLLLLTACGAREQAIGPVQFQTPQARLVALRLTPQEPSLSKGARAFVAARGEYSDYSSEDLSGQVEWSSSNAQVARVAGSGAERFVVGLSPGHALLTAELNGLRQTTLVTVRDQELARVELSLAEASVPRGALLALTATGVYADGSRADFTSSVTFRSEKPALLEVLGTTARGLEQGSVRVSATYEGLSGEALVEVTSAQRTGLVVMPGLSSIASDTTTRVRALATYSDGSTVDVTALADFRSDSEAVALETVQGLRGLAHGMLPGTARVEASYDGFSAWAPLEVRDVAMSSLRLEQGRMSLVKGTQAQFQLVGRFSDGVEQDLTADADWASDAPNVLEAYNGLGRAGVVLARAEGQSQISASALGQRVGLIVTVSAARLEWMELRAADMAIAKGLSQQLRAVGHYTDGSEQDLTAAASWSCSSPELADVSDAPATRGQLRALQTGTVVVRAVLNGEDVTLPITIAPAKLTGLRLRSDAVNLERAVVVAGNKLALFVDGIYSDDLTEDLTAAIELRSSDESVLALGADGRLYAVGEGTARVTASFKDLTAAVDVAVVR